MPLYAIRAIVDRFRSKSNWPFADKVFTMKSSNQRSRQQSKIKVTNKLSEEPSNSIVRHFEFLSLELLKFILNKQRGGCNGVSCSH